MEQDKKILDHIKAKPKLEVPDNYFENFHDNLLQEIKQKPIIIPIYKRKTFWLISIAASLLFLLFINDFTPFNHDKSNLLSKNELNDTIIKQNTINVDTTKNTKEKKSIQIKESLKKEFDLQTSKPLSKSLKTSSDELLLNLKDEDILDYLNEDSIEDEDIKILLN